MNDVKNVKKNWRLTQSSPYASLMFKYKTTKITIILFSAYIMYIIIKMALGYQGMGWNSWIMRIFTVGIGLLIVSKAYGTLTPLKKAMEPYENKRELIDHVESDTRVDIDDILNQFGEDGKRINNHPGKRELNKKQRK